MKKILLAILTVLTMVCVFAISASAYENKYYSIYVPSDYTVEEEGNYVKFLKGEEIFIAISVTEDDYTDFSDLTASERASYDDMIKSSYEENGIISDYESSFADDGGSASAMGYSFTYSNPDDATDYVYITGALYSDRGILYYIATMYTEDADYSEISDIMDTINFTPEGSSGSVATGQKIYYKSQNGVLSLTLPVGFVEEDSTGSLDKMWMSKDNTFGVSTLISDNIYHERLANIDDATVEVYKNQFANSSGLTNAIAEKIVINGNEGVHIYGGYTIGTVSGDMEAYMFATYDNLYAVYFYDLGDINADTYKREILNSLNIADEIYYGEITTEPSTQPSTVPSTQPTVPSDDITAPAGEEVTVQDNEEEKDGDKDDEKDNEKDKKDNTLLFIIIGAVLLIAIIAIVAIVIVGNNKKKAVQNDDLQFAQNFNPQQYQNNFSQNPPMNNYNNNGGFDQNNNF